MVLTLEQVHLAALPVVLCLYEELAPPEQLLQLCHWYSVRQLGPEKVILLIVASHIFALTISRFKTHLKGWPNSTSISWRRIFGSFSLEQTPDKLAWKHRFQIQEVIREAHIPVHQAGQRHQDEKQKVLQMDQDQS